jgi:hypothetical protein
MSYDKPDQIEAIESLACSGSGLAEALALIQATAVDAAGVGNKVELLDLPHEPPGYYGVLRGEDIEVRQAQRSPIHIKLYSVDQVPEFAKRIKEDWKGNPAIYYDLDMIAISVDDGLDSQRRDYVTLALQKTPEWDLVSSGATSKPRGQKEFLRLLRVDLQECGTDSLDKLIEVCRKLSHTSRESGSREINAGRESMGRSVEAELRSEAGEIPTTVDLNVRLFEDRAISFRRTVRCQVEIDAADNSFELIPLPGYLRDVQERGIEDIEARLASASCPKIFGQPN